MWYVTYQRTGSADITRAAIPRDLDRTVYVTQLARTGATILALRCDP